MQYENSCLTTNITKALQPLHFNLKIGLSQVEKNIVSLNAAVESISLKHLLTKVQ